jgi:hypothetical protein
MQEESKCQEQWELRETAAVRRQFGLTAAAVRSHNRAMTTFAQEANVRADFRRAANGNSDQGSR